jgi:E3 ubiquitin-protein ligase HECTD2
MVPLTPRLKSSSPQKEHSIGTGLTNRNGVSSARPRGHSRLTEADLLELAYGIPSLHASPDTSSPSSNNTSLHVKPTSKHGRSMSHPFPLLFQSKQKHQGINALNIPDLSDGDIHIPSSQDAPRIASSKFSRASGMTLVTGRCMTCDSKVRWPKELLVFRCTVCLTINDLKPISATAPERDIQGSYHSSGQSTSAASASFSRSMAPFSLYKYNN